MFIALTLITINAMLVLKSRIISVNTAIPLLLRLAVVRVFLKVSEELEAVSSLAIKRADFRRVFLNCSSTIT